VFPRHRRLAGQGWYRTMTAIARHQQLYGGYRRRRRYAVGHGDSSLVPSVRAGGAPPHRACSAANGDGAGRVGSRGTLMPGQSCRHASMSPETRIRVRRTYLININALRAKPDHCQGVAALKEPTVQVVDDSGPTKRKGLHCCGIGGIIGTFTDVGGRERSLRCDSVHDAQPVSSATTARSAGPHHPDKCAPPPVLPARPQQSLLCRRSPDRQRDRCRARSGQIKRCPAVRAPLGLASAGQQRRQLVKLP